MNNTLVKSAPFALIGVAVTFIATMVAGWFTHIFHCFQHAEYLLLIAGAIVAPVGSIHGIGLWFGAW